MKPVWILGLLLVAAPAQAKRRAKPTRIEPPPVVLAAGRWDPKVRQGLLALAASRGKDSPGYNPDQRPVAVLPFDDASAAGDLGEAAFWRLVRRVDFKFDDAFWNLVPIAYGRQKIRAAYEQFSSEPKQTWSRQEPYQQYLKYFVSEYQRLCANVGRKECRSYLASLWKGFNRDDALDYARETAREELAAPSGPASVGDPADPVFVRRGLRPVPEMKDLVAFLKAYGFDVRLVDLDAQPVLEAAAETLGIEGKDAFGVRLGRIKDRFNGAVQQPVPIRGGKVEAVVSQTGQAPALVIGASSEDLELLGYGEGLRIILDRGDKALLEEARRKGWLVQPALKP